MSTVRQAPCWLSVAEAASYLHTRKETVREAIARGDLVAYRHGKIGTIVHTDDLDLYVRSFYEPAMCLNAARRVVAKAGDGR